MKHKKCPKCELNYIKDNQDICAICKQGSADFDVCIYCGGTHFEGSDICQICKESLSLIDIERALEERADTDNI